MVPLSLELIGLRMEQWKVWKQEDNFGLFAYAQRLASSFWHRAKVHFPHI